MGRVYQCSWKTKVALSICLSWKQDPATPLVFVLTWPVVGKTAAIDCNAPSVAVSTQQDADSLRQCASTPSGFDGNVTINPDATGSLNFTGYRLIAGFVVAEDNPSLETLYFHSGLAGHIDGSVRGFILTNLSNLQAFTAPTVKALEGGIEFRDLPKLETINMPALLTPAYIHLDNLPRLKDILVSSFGIRAYFDVKLRNLESLESVDPFFSVGSPQESVSVEGIPNVHQLSYSIGEAGTVSITGNGNLSLSYDCSTESCAELANSPRKLTVRDLTVSGAASISRDYSQGGAETNITVGTFTVMSNTFSDLSINFTRLTTLQVVDNPNLVTLSFGPTARLYSLTNINISKNPALRLNSTTSRLLPAGEQPVTTTFIWPDQDATSMEFDGQFDDSFFKPFIDLGVNSKRPRVLSKFVVKSTLGPDEFSISSTCSKLNELRRAGIIKGEYSCQGQTVPDESKAARMQSWGILGLKLGMSVGIMALSVLVGVI